MAHDTKEREAALDVILVDPDRLFREALSNVLTNSEFNVVCMAASLDELGERKALEPKPGRHRLVIVDFDESDGENVRHFSELLKGWPDVKFIVIAREVTTSKLRLALELGVHACLTKDISFESFQKYVRLVMSGESVFPVGLAKTLVADLAPSPNRPSPEDVLSNLTPRERAILECLTEGASNKMIARKLGVSDATVKVNIKTLLRKINVSNRTQAATWAVQQGIGNRGVAQERDGPAMSKPEGTLSPTGSVPTAT